MITAYWFPDLQVTAVDRGGPHVNVYACDPTTALGGEVAPVHSLNVWDHKAGARHTVTPADVEDGVRAWATGYPDA